MCYVGGELMLGLLLCVVLFVELMWVIMLGLVIVVLVLVFVLYFVCFEVVLSGDDCYVLGVLLDSNICFEYCELG